MKIFTETERLILREVLPTDTDGFFELDSDPEVHKYLGNKPIQNKSQAEEIITFIRNQYIDNGIGRWAMVEKSTNSFIGWTGLKLVTEKINNQSNYHDLGYRLIRKFWGKGYATESAIASLNYGFTNLNLHEIVGIAHINNTASNAILKKTGFRFVKQFEYDHATHNWYCINKNEWKNNIIKQSSH